MFTNKFYKLLQHDHFKLEQLLHNPVAFSREMESLIVSSCETPTDAKQQNILKNDFTYEAFGAKDNESIRQYYFDLRDTQKQNTFDIACRAKVITKLMEDYLLDFSLSDILNYEFEPSKLVDKLRQRFEELVSSDPLKHIQKEIFTKAIFGDHYDAIVKEGKDPFELVLLAYSAEVIREAKILIHTLPDNEISKLSPLELQHDFFPEMQTQTHRVIIGNDAKRFYARAKSSRFAMIESFQPDNILVIHEGNISSICEVLNFEIDPNDKHLKGIHQELLELRSRLSVADHQAVFNCTPNEFYTKTFPLKMNKDQIKKLVTGTQNTVLSHSQLKKLTNNFDTQTNKRLFEEISANAIERKETISEADVLIAAQHKNIHITLDLNQRRHVTSRLSLKTARKCTELTLGRALGKSTVRKFTEFSGAYLLEYSKGFEALTSGRTLFYTAMNATYMLGSVFFAMPLMLLALLSANSEYYHLADNRAKLRKEFLIQSHQVQRLINETRVLEKQNELNHLHQIGSHSLTEVLLKMMQNADLKQCHAEAAKLSTGYFERNESLQRMITLLCRYKAEINQNIATLETQKAQTLDPPLVTQYQNMLSLLNSLSNFANQHQHYATSHDDGIVKHPQPMTWKGKFVDNHPMIFGFYGSIKDFLSKKIDKYQQSFISGLVATICVLLLSTLFTISLQTFYFVAAGAVIFGLLMGYARHCDVKSDRQFELKNAHLIEQRYQLETQLKFSKGLGKTAELLRAEVEKNPILSTEVHNIKMLNVTLPMITINIPQFEAPIVRSTTAIELTQQGLFSLPSTLPPLIEVLPAMPQDSLLSQVLLIR